MSESTTDDRKRLFARTFRSVGQVAHLLQDMAVPAHVRNDMQGHLYFSKILYDKIGGNPINWFGNNFEAYVLKNSSTIQSGGAVPSTNGLKLWDLWDSTAYASSNQDIDSTGIGLAEKTAANFLSQDKMLDAYKMLNKYKHPSIDDCKLVKETITIENGKTKDKYYFRMQKGLKVQHLAGTSILNRFGLHIESLDFLDDECFKEYANYLVPKAVDYSTALINYFFRGTLEISMPDRYLYSIADGSKLKTIGGVQQEYFDYIKAKVKNTTPGEATPAGGKLWAIAKYKKIKHYQPALASDVPLATDRETDFSYSVSAEIPNTTNLAEAEEFKFNFAGDPIPAGITDLTLQVVYRGTLGTEDGAVAVSPWKNLTEPTHLGFFNNTDYMYFSKYPSGYAMTTADEIMATCDDYGRNCSGQRPLICDPEICGDDCENRLVCGGSKPDESGYHNKCAYPVEFKLKLWFYPPGNSIKDSAHVLYNPLPGGSYGRILLLTDNETNQLNAHFRLEPLGGSFPWVEHGKDNWPCNIVERPFTEGDLYQPITMAVYQDEGAGVPEVKLFRGTRVHGLDFVWENFEVSPDIVVNQRDAPWPALTGDNETPVQFEQESLNP